MTLKWEKVYVFISSTFNDMHAERDYLVKQVFPRLQEWCERRKLRLVDIDLRWGVSGEAVVHQQTPRRCGCSWPRRNVAGRQVAHEADRFCDVRLP